MKTSCENIAMCNVNDLDHKEYQFHLINGELVLVLKVTQSAEDCTHCIQTIFYNALTGERVVI